MFDLEKREKFILLVLLTALLIGIVFGFYQKRAVRIDVKSLLEKPSVSLTGLTYSAPGPSTGTFKININDSDAARLMKLKGVGKVLAGRIVEYRSTNGRFRSVEELKKVKGLGQKLYEKIKDEVFID